MTETIKTVLINYGVCALVGGLLEHIAPQRTRSTLRGVVVIVLVFGIVSPFVGSDFEFSGLVQEYDGSDVSQTDALMHTANLTEKKIKDDMREILINTGINEYEIYVSTSVDKENNTVYLDEVRVEVAKQFEEKINDIYDCVTAEYKAVLKVGVKNE